MNNSNNSLAFSEKKAFAIKASECAKLTDANEDWIPEKLTGSSYKALKVNIQKHGLLHPIIVDTDNKVWDGRSRLMACKELGIPVKAIKVSPKEGLEAARSGALQRDMTVLDEVRLVKWAESLPEITQKNGETKEKVSKYLQDSFGKRRMSPSQVRDILKLARQITSKHHEKIVRKAKSVNDALGSLDPSRANKASAPSKSASTRKPSSEPVKVIREAEKTITQLGKAAKASSDKNLVKACKSLKTKLEKFLKE